MNKKTLFNFEKTLRNGLRHSKWCWTHINYPLLLIIYRLNLATTEK